MPRKSSYSLPRQLPHHYFASSYVFHLDANTQPQLRELAKCSNLDYMYNDYHSTHAAFHVTFRFFLPNPVESKPYVDKSVEEDQDATGTGNQSTAPESEQYNQVKHSILTENAQDNVPRGENIAHFLQYHPDYKYGPRDIRNFVFGEGMFD